MEEKLIYNVALNVKRFRSSTLLLHAQPISRTRNYTYI